MCAQASPEMSALWENGALAFWSEKKIFLKNPTTRKIEPDLRCVKAGKKTRLQQDSALLGSKANGSVLQLALGGVQRWRQAQDSRKCVTEIGIIRGSGTELGMQAPICNVLIIPIFIPGLQ